MRRDASDPADLRQGLRRVGVPTGIAPHNAESSCSGSRPKPLTRWRPVAFGDSIQPSWADHFSVVTRQKIRMQPLPGLHPAEPGPAISRRELVSKENNLIPRDFNAGHVHQEAGRDSAAPAANGTLAESSRFRCRDAPSPDGRRPARGARGLVRAAFRNEVQECICHPTPVQAGCSSRRSCSTRPATRPTFCGRRAGEVGGSADPGEVSDLLENSSGEILRLMVLGNGWQAASRGAAVDSPGRRPADGHCARVGHSERRGEKADQI